ncbi:hypothetical protein VTI74DRAFT_4410 [Chaetomium olivicolor]
MCLFHLAAAAFSLWNIGVGSPVPQGGAASAAKYCDPLTTICYSEWLSLEKIAFRIAIPDTATAGNFDVLLKLLLPRLARTYPTPYTGATYTVLPGSTANTTHWALNVLAKGISAWGSTKLNPSGNVFLAYAQSASPPAEPANNVSRFSIHNSRSKWSHDLKSAQIRNFAELVEKASARAAKSWPSSTGLTTLRIPWLYSAPTQGGLKNGYDEKKCNLWLCKGYQFADNTGNVQDYKPVVIGAPLIASPDNYTASMNPPANQTKFGIEIPELGGKCAEAGACVIQWYWFGQGQTYESCIEFTVPAATPGSGHAHMNRIRVQSDADIEGARVLLSSTITAGLALGISTSLVCKNYGALRFGRRDTCKVVSRRFYKAIQIVGLILMSAIAIGATVLDAFGNPDVKLSDDGEKQWSFGQHLSLLMLMLPVISVIETMRGEIAVAAPVDDENKQVLFGEELSDKPQRE